MPQPLILIVDDDSPHRSMLRTVLRGWGYAVEEAEDGAAAVEQVKARAFDAVLTDVRMARLDGIAALREIREWNPSIPVLIMTAWSSVQNAVDALRLGAYDYLTKPLELDELKLALERALDHTRLARESQEPGRAQSEASSLLLGRSEAMRELVEMVETVAPTEATVLVSGESGTGKELVANAVHAHSRRSGKPFVALNCAAIPEALMESEIFGYDAGAFSGANPRGKKGLMETAHGGTLFLDEIADMPVSLQAKLLRALQERSFLRVGGKTPCRVDVRIIAAANRSLRELVEAGRFREDLYFRLNVFPLRVPPLRERTGDVRLLTGFFLNQFSVSTGRILHITSELLNWFENYRWPGNIRELKNFIEYGVNFCENGVLDLELMRHRFETAQPGSGGPARGFRSEHVFPPDSLHARLAEKGRGMEAKRLLAAEMGISLATLYRRLHEEKRKLGIL